VPLTGSLSGGDGDYLFEQDTLVLGEARGYADVFYRDHFAWENKAPGRNLDSTLKQLLTYSLSLSNPPLLVVCDRLILRIHTQFNGHPSEVHTVLLHEMDQPDKQSLLRRLWLDPESFRPKKTSRDITEAAAKSFSTLADGLRRRSPLFDAVPVLLFCRRRGLAARAHVLGSGEQQKPHQRQAHHRADQPVHRHAQGRYVRQ